MKNKELKVHFTGSIDKENVREFIRDVKKLNDKYPESDSITVYISSAGGNVDIAIELYNFLQLLDARITMINISCVNSAAVVVFAAGDKRIALPSASFYVHSVTKHLNGDFDIRDLSREIREMSANTEKIASILSLSSNKNKSYWKRLMGKGYLLTPQKAKELGLVNDISECK